MLASAPFTARYSVRARLAPAFGVLSGESLNLAPMRSQVDPDDGRARRLRLTAEGQRLGRWAIAAVEETDARFFGAEAGALTAPLQRVLGPGLASQAPRA